MNIEDHYTRLRNSFKSKLQLLDDKPEETIDSTLRALWFSAYGSPKSAEATAGLDLPELSHSQIEILNELIARRLQNHPLAHITGRQRFMGIDFITDKRALIPRKETEILGNKALELSFEIGKIKDSVDIVDVCCGAGNLGIAIASHNKMAKVFSTDISEEAIELTKENIAFNNLVNRVSAGQGDLFSSIENDLFFEKTDIIVCNPPYISTSKAKNLKPETSENEPFLAFDGGMFGTKIIQKLITEAPKFLRKNGWLIFEVGVGQGDFVMKLCKTSNRYEMVESLLDQSGNIRVLAARK